MSRLIEEKDMEYGFGVSGMDFRLTKDERAICEFLFNEIGKLIKDANEELGYISQEDDTSYKKFFIGRLNGLKSAANVIKKQLGYLNEGEKHECR